MKVRSISCIDKLTRRTIILHIITGKELPTDARVAAAGDDSEGEDQLMPLLQEPRPHYATVEQSPKSSLRDTKHLAHRTTSTTAPTTAATAAVTTNNRPGKTTSSSSGNAGKYTKEELAARTPWVQLFTHPVALALMYCTFGYVSKLCIAQICTD